MKHIDWTDVAIVGSLTLAGVFAISLLGIALYRDVVAEHYVLDESERGCSKTEIRKQHRTLVVGKMIIPQTEDVEVCVEYRRVK